MGNICFGRRGISQSLRNELRGQLCNRCHPLQKYDSCLPPLMRAIFKGHDTCVEALLKLGANVNNPPNPGETPLIVAAKGGFDRCVALLIRAGADVRTTDRLGKTALDYAEIKGHDTCVALLVQAGNDDGQSLISAAKFNLKSYVEELLQGGVDPNTSDNDGKTPLMHACENGHLVCTEALLKAKAKVDSTDDNGLTALMYASGNGHQKCVEALLKKEADIKIVTNAGHSALTTAAKGGSSQCLDLLIKAGANVNKGTNDNFTPLILATTASSDSLECMQLLLKAGALINTTTTEGQNAIQILSGRTDVYARKDKLMLLFAAGEIFENKPSDDLNIPQQNANEANSCLKSMCREFIRKRLLSANPHDHLFGIISKLSLPSAVVDYLLYNVKL